LEDVGRSVCVTRIPG